MAAECNRTHRVGGFPDILCKFGRGLLSLEDARRWPCMVRDATAQDYCTIETEKSIYQFQYTVDLVRFLVLTTVLNLALSPDSN